MAIIVPAVLGGLAILVVVAVSVIASKKGKQKAAAQKQSSAQPRILVHSINDDRCVGCDACVAVCPTNVLDLVDNKSRVLRFEDCIQCEACMWACPTEALVMHLEGTEPPRLKVPDIDENFETPVKGQYLIGEVSGKPLVKNAANLGRMTVEHMLQNGIQKGGTRAPNPQARAVDVAIVGSGPAGISTALSCIYHGLSYVVLEKEQLLASTIARYPKGKLVMAEPYDVVNRSFLPVFDSSKEQIIPIWDDLIQQVGVEVKKGEAVENVQKDEGSGVFHVRTTVSEYYAQRVVLAIGSRGKPRTLGVQGENLPKVNSLLEDPDDHRGQSVLVVGGGDSALEAAIALADAGAQVSISYRSKGFNRAAPKNKATIESYQNQRRIDVYFQSQVDHITESTVTLNLSDGSQKEIPNDATFVLIGADPPTKWLEKVGVGVVEKPHQFQLGKSDEKLLGYLGQNAPVCPESAAAAAAMVRGEAAPEAQAPAEEGGARKFLRSATQIFAPQKKDTAGVPLGEFANRRHTGDGRRDMLDPAERTRVLRMLRDVGGRMADEAPEPEAAATAETGADSLESDRLREAGLRGVTYPSIDIPKVPGLTQALDSAEAAEAVAAAQGQQGGSGKAPPVNQTMMGVPGAATPTPGQGHGLHAASQLREQAKQKQEQQASGGSAFPQDAKTVVEMAVPQELLKHSVGAKRKQASEEKTVVAGSGLFADDDKTQMAHASTMAPGAASAGNPPASPPQQDPQKTRVEPIPEPVESGGSPRGPAESAKKTLFDPAPPDFAPGPSEAAKTRHEPISPPQTSSSASAESGNAPSEPPPTGDGSGGDPRAAAAPQRATLFGQGPAQAPGGGHPGGPGSAAPPEASRAPAAPSSKSPNADKTLFASGAPTPGAEGAGEVGSPSEPDARGEAASADQSEGGESESPSGGEGPADSRRTLRSVNVQFGDEATTAADVSELVRKMSEERKRRDE